MEDRKTNEEDHVDKVPFLNKIFEDLISDASDLIRDLYWGVKTYLIFGLMTILFGLQELFSNMDRLGEQFYIPAFIAGTLIFSGLAQIINFFRLRKKYARLFKAQADLKNS
ncbi:MAG: hypothetical protein QG670_2278 [Thermoproteota archaeon]|nr:hypothetical protein [Thermoproteota archaeon]